ncbi:hypothetical protein RO21_09055 [[Actinobacillus] muris]|uniref:Bacteriophage lambda Replication protein O N-terminal domain-containing protein n=2 Tax=Muribacter muris TaxID=67855 RepID=A0A0J5P634_9PAST|nr:hypothetical protein RO21_09055 [[Actinobacillus] muris] [Muribacter muris]
MRNTPILTLHRNTQEAKKVSIDDGFTAIPNELLFAMGKFGFTQRQFNLLLAVIQKTLSWHKEMDWISNAQLCELVDLPDEQKASKTKQELVRMNVLVQKGNKIGLNLSVSEWKKADCTKEANLARNVQKTLHKSCNSDCTKRANTKETITKQKINNTPLPPKGEVGSEAENEVLAQAQALLDYYNGLAQGACRDTQPFITLLTKTTSREAYTPDDIKLVIRWVLKTWSRRNNRPAKPVNICRVTRFDGYLSDAVAWERSRNQVDCADVVEVYNEILGPRLGEFELDDAAEKQIWTLLEHLKDKSINGFRNYFQAFADTARAHYFGDNQSGWKAGFGYLMKPETLIKTRREEL